MFISKTHKAIYDINKNIDKMTCEKLDKNYLIKKANFQLNMNSDNAAALTNHEDNNKEVIQRPTKPIIIPIKSDLLNPVTVDVKFVKYNYISKSKNKEFGKDILQSFKYHFANKLMKNFKIYVFKSKLTKLYKRIIVRFIPLKFSL